MVHLSSVQTFSGLFAFLALVALLNRCVTLGGLLLTVAGAAGLGVFWERWSQRTGYEVEIEALWHPVFPSAPQVWLLITHSVMLLLGLGLLAALARTRSEGGAA